MRVTAFILAMLMLVLSCLPCADVDDDATQSTNVTCEISKTSNQQHKPEHKDSCSPFCHCSCCASYFVIKVPFTIPLALVESVNPVYTVHFTEEVHEISLPVWQPPQLA